MYDVAIVGGGPTGLACAIESARRGFSTVLLERRALPCDKACGEGLMPAGVRALDLLGALDLLPSADATPFVGVHYIQEDGSYAEGLLPHGGGLGVRRTALSLALSRRARVAGAEVREQVVVRSHARTGRSIVLHTQSDRLEARLLVAADGLASPLRTAEGLDRPVSGPRRFGLRMHFCVAPWTRFVEVHFASDAEAYVTPTGDHRVGVAFLWDAARVAHPVSFEALLSRFPPLQARLSGTPPDSVARGAGPLLRASRAQVTDRFALLGDAAGYVDAITGEGLSLGLFSASLLGSILPSALSRGASEASLMPYQRAYQQAYRNYAWLARGLVLLSSRPALRRRVIHFLGAHPRVFDRLLLAVTG